VKISLLVYSLTKVTPIFAQTVMGFRKKVNSWEKCGIKWVNYITHNARRCLQYVMRMGYVVLCNVRWYTRYSGGHLTGRWSTTRCENTVTRSERELAASARRSTVVRAEHRSECQSHAGIYMTKERVAYKVSLTPFWWS